MARFERPSGRSDSRGGSRDRFPSRSPSRGRSDSGRGGSDRGFNSYNRGGDRRDIQRTKVTCSKCGIECEVPFKPTSNKPVYCDACFGKNDSGHSDHNNHSAPSAIPTRDLDIINEKLNKIMKALEIE